MMVVMVNVTIVIALPIAVMMTMMPVVIIRQSISRGERQEQEGA